MRNKKLVASLVKLMFAIVVKLKSCNQCDLCLCSWAPNIEVGLSLLLYQNSLDCGYQFYKDDNGESCEQSLL
jgi:hypothetical protein